MLKTLPALAALLAASALVAPTVGQAAETNSVRVSYADLNLTSDFGRNSLQNRIAFAAETVCGPADHRDVPFTQKVRECRTATIADVQVPRGTIVWCVMRADSISDAHFPDSAAFKPERWLGDGAAASPLSSAKRVSMPFGAGPRVCPGRYLALLEIKMAMAMLLAHFEIDAVDTPNGAEPVEHMSFTMSPLGLSMRLRERDVRSH